MVFSKLLDSISNLLSYKDNNNERKTENINKAAINELQQGMILLNTRKNNINKLRKKSKLLESMKDFSKGEATLKDTTNKELKILNDLETDFQRQISEYTTNYKTFMDMYNKGTKEVVDCKANCLSLFPRSDPEYSRKKQACQAGCTLKGPYVQQCKDSYKKSARFGNQTCSGVTKGRCSDGNVVLGAAPTVTSSDYADTAGTTIKDGCCDCGGGYGGPPTVTINAKVIKKCDELAGAMGFQGNDGNWANSACYNANVPSEYENQVLYEEYDKLTQKNDALITTAKTIFDKIQALQKVRKDIDGEGDVGGLMGLLDVKLNDQLNDFGTTFAEIKKIRSTKDRTLDGQLEDIRNKENSQTLHFLIWSGLAILIILMVIQRMRK